MDLIHKIDGVVYPAKFIFGVYKDQSLLFGNFLTALKKLKCIFFKNLPFISTYKTLGDNFLFADVLVMTFRGLGAWGNNWSGEVVIFLHSIRHCNTAK